MMDINTDLTRGRVLSGKSFVNPQTRSASLGGYYGYYHSIRSGGEWEFTPPNRPSQVSLQAFLDNANREGDVVGNPHFMLCFDEVSRFYRMDRTPIIVRRGVRKTISGICRWGRSVWYNRYGYARGRQPDGYVPSLYAFLKYSGNIAASFEDDERAECIGTGDDEAGSEYYYVLLSGPSPLKSFLRTYRPVRDYNKFFILHGTFFFELESGNMETVSGRLAYDSDETWGIRFIATTDTGSVNLDPGELESLVRAASEEEQVALTLQNASATSLLLEEIEWLDAQRSGRLREVALPQLEAAVSNPATPI